MEIAARAGEFRSDERRSRRRLIDLGALIEDEGERPSEVRVIDLSEHGLRMAADQPFPVGAAIWLKLPGLEAVHARVVWAEDCECGCELDPPLHPKSIELLTRMQARRGPAAPKRRPFGPVG
ncbi:MAG TPA: PilZ domain-containing protein [Allosphingosinicella sp.]|nr:PilZ domain-containing protein [Allosphingosinicella sp.]